MNSSLRPHSSPLVVPAPELSHPDARLALTAAVRSLAALVGEPRLTLDMSAVTQLDADGVATLLDCWKTCTEAGGQLTLIRMSPHLCVLMQVARLHVVFPEVQLGLRRRSGLRRRAITEKSGTSITYEMPSADAGATRA